MSSARDPSDFGAERGLFGISDDDRRDADRVPRGWRKNVDFLRLKDFALHLVAPAPGMKLLDLGCANGAQMVMCGLQGAEVHGQDLDAARVADANQKLERLGIQGRAVVGDVTSLCFDDGVFDVVLSSDFHEHLPWAVQVAACAEARRVLKPGGFLVIKTPNRSYLHAALRFKQLRALTQGRDPRGYVIPHTDRSGPHAHVGLTTHRELSRCLHDAGYQNWQFFYAPLRRLGVRQALAILSTEVPALRDILCEDVFCKAYKPISISYFPD